MQHVATLLLSLSSIISDLAKNSPNNIPTLNIPPQATDKLINNKNDMPINTVCADELTKLIGNMELPIMEPNYCCEAERALPTKYMKINTPCLHIGGGKTKIMPNCASLELYRHYTVISNILLIQVKILTIEFDLVRATSLSSKIPQSVKHIVFVGIREMVGDYDFNPNVEFITLESCDVFFENFKAPSLKEIIIINSPSLTPFVDKFKKMGFVVKFSYKYGVEYYNK